MSRGVHRKDDGMCIEKRGSSAHSKNYVAAFGSLIAGTVVLQIPGLDTSAL
jgi:hypothetical protein